MRLNLFFPRKDNLKISRSSSFLVFLILSAVFYTSGFFIFQSIYAEDGGSYGYGYGYGYDDDTIPPILVDDDFIDDPANHKWNTIQEGVNDASEGDMIIVRDGTYTENINVNKSHLTIKSENGAEKTIVQAANPDDHVFEVTADYVNVSGFTVKGGANGINLEGVNHCDISNGIISNNSYNGIKLSGSINVTVKDNKVTGWNGIALGYSSQNRIIGNEVYSGGNSGINLVSSSNNKIEKNNIHNNSTGLYFHNGLGIDDYNEVKYNKFLNNNLAIGFYGSQKNIIYLNYFINSGWKHINPHSIYSADLNSQEKITYAYNNSVYTNYLGNYWGGYISNDANNDGINDSSYSFGNSPWVINDNYPLVQPFENYVVPVPPSEGGGGVPPIVPPDNQPPIISDIKFNGSSSSELLARTTSVFVSFQTNEISECGYSDLPNASYDSMGLFSITGGLNHSKEFNGLSDGTSYNYYAKCKDSAGNTSDDYLISFSVEEENQSPNSPILISPGSNSEPGEIIDIFTPLFEWQFESEAVLYTIVISEYPYGTNNVVYKYENMFDNLFAMPSGVLENGKKYRWNVQSSYDGTNWSDASDVLYFQIALADNQPSVSTKFKIGDYVKFDVDNECYYPYSCKLKKEPKEYSEIVEEMGELDMWLFVEKGGGSILENENNGIFIDNSYWWYVKFSSDGYNYYTGWVKESWIEINLPPIAKFEISNSKPKIGEEILIDASLSKDPDGNIGDNIEYRWECIELGTDNVAFKDVIWTSEPKIFYYWTPQYAGNKYYIRLTVKDNNGLTVTSSPQFIEIENSLSEQIKEWLFSKTEKISRETLVEITSELNLGYYDFTEYELASLLYKRTSIANEKLIKGEVDKEITSAASKATNIVMIENKLGEIKTINNILSWQSSVDLSKEIDNDLPILVARQYWKMIGKITVEGLIEKLLGLVGVAYSKINDANETKNIGKGMAWVEGKVSTLEFWRKAKYYNTLREYLKLRSGNGTYTDAKTHELAWKTVVYNDGKEGCIAGQDNCLFSKEYTPIGFAELEKSYEIFGDTYEKYINETGLKDDFKQQIKESLKKELLAAKDIYRFELLLPDSNLYIQIKSPGELRVYDSQGNVTGLVNGEIKEEILDSVYDAESKTVVIFSPSDISSYRYEVVGIEKPDEKTYGLTITSVNNGEAITFSATDIPTTPGEIHQYTIDWDALSQGGEGTTMQIDANGDGSFEKTIKAGLSLQLPADDNNSSSNTTNTGSSGGGGGGAIISTTLSTKTSIIINNGESDTASKNVTLALSASNVAQMAISNSLDFAGVSWEDYKISKEWILTSGASEKTVYAKFRSSTGGVSSVVSDNITLSTGKVLGTTTADITDGDIIQCKNCSNPFAVYIVKIVGNTKYIRHIVSIEIFNYYGHLKWENLKQVSSLGDYSLSGWVRYNTGANGTAGPTDKVYEINGDRTKHWVNMTVEQFLSHGGSDPAIYSVNQGELNLYTTGADVMSL